MEQVKGGGGGEGRQEGRFPSSPSPIFHFWLSLNFPRRQNTKNPVPRLSLLPNPTETLATQAKNNLIFAFALDKGFNTKASKRTRVCRLVLLEEKVLRCLVEVRVKQKGKRRHYYICLCCFSRCRWNTWSLNQGIMNSIEESTQETLNSSQCPPRLVSQERLLYKIL